MVPPFSLKTAMDFTFRVPQQRECQLKMTYAICHKNKTNKSQTKIKAYSWFEGQVATMLESHTCTRQIDTIDTIDTASIKQAGKNEKKRTIKR